MARTGRPRIHINRKKISHENKEQFCREFLEEIWGGPLPDFVDPVKNFKRGLRSLPREQQPRALRYIFLSRVLSLKSRLTISVFEWVKPYFRGSRKEVFEFCGFTIDELIDHIEKQFQPWMTWENWGEWHIDHIIPRCRYLKPFTQGQVFGLQNLRPLSRRENLRKSSRLENE